MPGYGEGEGNKVGEDAEAAAHSDPMDEAAAELAEALVKEGIAEGSAQRMALIVMSHMASEHAHGASARVTFRRQSAEMKWRLSLAVTISALIATVASAVPLLKQLNANGFAPAAGLVGVALAVVSLLAGYRLSSLRRASKGVTIQVEATPGDHECPEGTMDHPTFEASDVGTFANAVGRVAGRNGTTYAVG